MFEKKWQAQCEAAEGIIAKHGVAAALDYLIGEKLDAHVQAASTNVKFRHELPRFVARIRELFARDDLESYFAAVEQAAPEPTTDSETLKLEQSGLLLDQASRRARMERLAPLKDLLLSERLGSA